MLIKGKSPKVYEFGARLSLIPHSTSGLMHIVRLFGPASLEYREGLERLSCADRLELNYVPVHAQKMNSPAGHLELVGLAGFDVHQDIV